jgi:hypothetical protein
MLGIMREENGNLKPIDLKYMLGISSRQNLTSLQNEKRETRR